MLHDKGKSFWHEQKREVQEGRTACMRILKASHSAKLTCSEITCSHDQPA